MTTITNQFALEFGLAPATFQGDANVFITGQANAGARYWARGAGDMVIYQDHLFVRCTNAQLTARLQQAFAQTPGQWFFEWSTLRQLDQLLHSFGWQITNHAPFFLPKGPLAKPTEPHLRLIERDEIAAFRTDARIHEAFAFDDDDPDLLGMGYFEGNQLKIVAGANQNGRYTWEIGIEVLDPAFARRGLAGMVVRGLAAEMQQRRPDWLVVYGTQFSHMRSMNLAIDQGFRVGWTEPMFSPIRRH
ncbi:GNAT family N-acetyltransferase [Lacticaseibacillus yichunensis]|uniref:GNAT family N-acetyltransferase n=1 Tax=Lacticaseibacillus yichunensis TaxID=2486015 RepID=A0ABW4CRF8_9LACO|nr:GNAT family N-acetyltransferase [Lacticaseibacillus yichunensis]